MDLTRMRDENHRSGQGSIALSRFRPVAAAVRWHREPSPGGLASAGAHRAASEWTQHDSIPLNCQPEQGEGEPSSFLQKGTRAMIEPPEWERFLAAERHLQHLILGRLEGVPTGLRQLRRTQPLETEILEGLRVPTLAEMARVKAWLLATRSTTRDYLDTVVLFERLGEDAVVAAMRGFDALYAQLSGASPLVEVVERLAAATPLDLPQVDLRTYRGLVPPWNDWEHVRSRGVHWSTVLAAAALGGRS